MKKFVLIPFTCLLAILQPAISQTTLDESLQKNIKIAQDKSFESLSKLYDCLPDYITKHLSPSIAIGDIADAALASCNQHIESYVTFVTAYRIATISAYSKNISWDEFGRRTRQAESDARLDGDRIRIDVRAIAVKYAIELREIVERVRQKKDGQPTVTPSPRPTSGA